MLLEVFSALCPIYIPKFGKKALVFGSVGGDCLDGVVDGLVCSSLSLFTCVGGDEGVQRFIALRQLLTLQQTQCYTRTIIIDAKVVNTCLLRCNRLRTLDLVQNWFLQIEKLLLRCTAHDYSTRDRLGRAQGSCALNLLLVNIVHCPQRVLSELLHHQHAWDLSLRLSLDALGNCRLRRELPL
jgi:hypothetical protein